MTPTVDRPRVARTVSGLSAPALEIDEGMLLVPLVGPITPERAGEITTETLRAIGRKRARVVLLDATGVSWIETDGISRLLDLIPSARLLGSTVILTGITGQVAGAMILSGFSLDDLTCATDLRTGIEKGRRLAGVQGR